MAELLDSGARREFGNGAVRDVADGKGRCDLLPLFVVARVLQPPTAEGDAILTCIANYMRNGNTSSLIRAIRTFAEDYEENYYTAMLEVAKQYEDGARKYDDRNWEKGIPVHVFIDSGVRHYLKFLRGDTDEPHDRAFIWNMLGAIWTHENKPELIDLPFAEQSKPNRPTQADLEELFTEPSEPVKGKYEGWSNEELAYKICCKVKCVDCPIPNIYGSEELFFEQGCDTWDDDHPEEFRAIAIAYLEGLDKQD